MLWFLSRHAMLQRPHQCIEIRYASKCNKLVQLVVQVEYDVNVIYSLGGGDTHKHTDFTDKSNFKKPGAPAKGLHTPGLKQIWRVQKKFFFLKQLVWRLVLRNVLIEIWSDHESYWTGPASFMPVLQIHNLCVASPESGQSVLAINPSQRKMFL